MTNQFLYVLRGSPSQARCLLRDTTPYAGQVHGVDHFALLRAMFPFVVVAVISVSAED